MNRGIVLGDWIYESILTQIYSGRLPKGSSLPTLEELCDQFGVGRNTIRSVLMQLTQNGYITTSRGKTATVLFDFMNPEQMQRYFYDLLNRRDIILDIFQCMEILLPDIAVYCAKTLTPEQKERVLNKATSFVERPDVTVNATVSGLLDLYTSFFSALNNHPLSDFLSCMMRYNQYPSPTFLLNREKHSQGMTVLKRIISHLADLLQADDFKDLHLAIIAFCREAKGMSARSLEALAAVVPNVPPANAKFYWFIDQKQEYRYAKIVADLLRKVGSGYYPQGSLLPSYSLLAKQYGVSIKTIEKAIATLNEYQVARTINGVGTRIRILSRQAPAEFFSAPGIRERLSLCLECARLVLLSCRSVILRGMEHVSPEQLKKLAGEFKGDSWMIAGPLLQLFFDALPSPCLHTFFEQMQNGMAWSACLEILNPNRSRWSKLLNASQEVLASLTHDDPQELADTFYQMFFFCCEAIEQLMAELPEPQLLR